MSQTIKRSSPPVKHRCSDRVRLNATAGDHRAFIRGGFAKITGRSATLLNERTPADLTRERFDEEVRQRPFATQRLVDNTRREAGFASNRLGLEGDARVLKGGMGHAHRESARKR
jgi:hypothetical protein